MGGKKRGPLFPLLGPINLGFWLRIRVILASFAIFVLFMAICFVFTLLFVFPNRALVFVLFLLIVAFLGLACC